VLFWYFVNVGLTFGCVVEALKLWRLVWGRAVSPRSTRFVICAALVGILPFLECMQAGQLGIATLYLLLAGFRLFIQSRSRTGPFLAGLVLALPASVKLLPSLPIVVLVLQEWSAVAFPAGARRPWSRALSLTSGLLLGAFVFLLAFPAMLIGWQRNLD